MNKFFRQIRKSLISENKMGKYFKYAIGEILLVVIGILIAIQINNWNIKSINISKEANYLVEIKNNLVSDIVSIDSIYSYNELKRQEIIKVFKLFENPEGLSDPEIFGERIFILGQYEFFDPINLGFENLISAESIGLIKDNGLRKGLLDYYNYDFQSGTQERAAKTTRDFIDYLMPLIFTKDRVEKTYNVTLKIPSNSDVTLANDQQLLAYLYLMGTVTKFQNQLLTATKKDIEILINNINSYLSDD